MALITSNGTGGGLASAGASWVGGVAPVLADDAVIAAGDTIELDGAIKWNSMQCSGVLKASRTMSSSMTLFAELGYTVEAGGVLDFGTAASPIPSAMLAEMIFDSPTAGGVVYKINDGGEFTSYGATTRNRCAALTVQALSGQDIVTVDDASGWAVGDRMCFESPYNGLQRISNAFTTTVSVVAGLQITLTANLPHQMEVGWLVGNTEANVIVRSNDLTEADRGKNPVVNIYRYNATSNNLFHATNTSFRGLGKSSAYQKWGIQFFGNGWILTTYADLSIAPTFIGCSVVNTAGGMYASYAGIVLSNHLTALMGISVWSPWADHATLMASNARLSGTGVFCFNLRYCLSTRGDVTDLRAVNCAYYAGGAGTINGGVCRHTQYVRQGTGGVLELHDVSIEYTSAYISSTGASADLICKDCTQVDEPAVYIQTGGGGQDAYDYRVMIVNKNGDPTGQFVYTLRGDMQRDNVVFKSGTASQKITPSSAVNNMTHKWQAIAVNAVPFAATGFIRMDAAYNGMLPKITLSGMGITPVVWTQAAGYAVDEWLQFTIAATHNAGADGLFDLLFECNGTTGSVWIDQIAAPPAVAVNTGDMGFYDKGAAMPVLLANFVTPIDVRNEFDANSSTMNFMRDIESGKWEITGSQMVFYKADQVTEMVRFNLFNAAGQAESDMSKVVKRVPV